MVVCRPHTAQQSLVPPIHNWHSARFMTLLTLHQRSVKSVMVRRAHAGIPSTDASLEARVYRRPGGEDMGRKKIPSSSPLFPRFASITSLRPVMPHMYYLQAAQFTTLNYPHSSTSLYSISCIASTYCNVFDNRISLIRSE